MDYEQYRQRPAPKRSGDSYGFLHRVGVFARRVAPFALSALALGLLASVALDLRGTFWCYYTDDLGVRREAGDPYVRFILWSHPDIPSREWGYGGARNGLKFHPDDRRMFLSMRTADTNRLDSDLFVNELDGNRWAGPQPLGKLNSLFDEYEVVESRDGRWRYFTSDRPGGAGGADVWAAALRDGEVVSITNLAGVNSAGNERGLALSPDGRTLYLASDRVKGRGFDIYRAVLAEPAGEDAAPGVVSVEPVAAVSSEADELQPELTPRGDLLYFASNREGGLGGYDLYAARLVRGVLQPAENVGVEINSAADEVAPAARMEGFDLAFRSNRRQADPAAFLVYSATCREVVESLDLSRLENYLALLNRLKWWVLVSVLALAALIYLVKRYRDLTDRFHKCLLASVIAHVVALFLVAAYSISRQVVDSLKEEPETMEVMVDPRTLKELKAQLDKRMESLSIDGTKAPTKMAAAAMLASVQDRGGAPLPETPPEVEGDGPTIVAKSTDKTSIAVVTPSAANPLRGEDMQKLRNLAEVKLAAPEAILLEAPPGAKAPGEVSAATAAGRGEKAGSSAGEEAGGARESDKLVQAAAVQRVVPTAFQKINDMPVAPVRSSESGDGAAETVVADLGPAVAVAKVKEGHVIRATPSDAAPRAVNVPGVAADPDPKESNAAAGAIALKGMVAKLDIGADGVVLEEPAAAPGAPGGAGSGATGTATGGVARAGTAEGAGFNPGLAQYAVGSGFSRSFEVGPMTAAAGGGGAREGESGAGGGAGVAGFGPTTGVGQTPLKDTGGALLIASAGGDGPTRVHEMDGDGTVLGTVKSGQGAGDLKYKLPGQLDVPAGFMERNPADLVHWVGRPSAEVVEALGGNSLTEGAIRGALDWFSKTQEEDGRWDCVKHGGEEGHDVAGTSLALLCYFGWGMKHNEECDYRKQVKAAVDWLLKTIKADGDLRNGNVKNGMYDQGIGAIALCEAYGVTRDPALFGPASNAVDFIVKAQGKEGGWRYVPGQGGDLSVFGWQYMALHSAKLSGIPFDEACLVRASNWLDRVSAGANGGFYGYDGPSATGERPAMMAVGMFCRQLQKFAPGHERMKETASWLRTRPLQGGTQMDSYYLYYTTLALYQHQGEIWEDWNKRMKEIVPLLQVKGGANGGSWNPGGRYGKQMGRVVMTGLTTLSMEVYYRYLPMYGYRAKNE